MAKPIIVCKHCNEHKTHEAKGLCKPCYNKTRLILCGNCGESGRAGKKGVCTRCYNRTPERQAQSRAKNKKRGHKRKIIKCWWCWKEKEHVGYNLCTTCYHLIPEFGEKDRKNARQWYYNNKERSYAKEKERLATPAGHTKKRQRINEHYAEDPVVREKAKQKAYKRYIKKKGVSGSYTKKEWIKRLEEFNYCCAYCEIALDDTNRTKDHVVPLDFGIYSSDDIENIVPACAICHSTKNDMEVIQFIHNYLPQILLRRR